MGAVPLGVSVVICCYNSSRRLPETLAHLASQQSPEGLPWEVLVVDNASTDDTAAVALACWPADAPAPLRVVPEPRTGLTYARQRGFKEVAFEFVSFIDDDNWVCPEWVRTIYELMTEHPDIGVCGSLNEAVCEVAPPAWFDRFNGWLAITPRDAPVGDVGALGAVVFGAGMTIRLQAWRGVLARGFSLLAVGRQGKVLAAGEDGEICIALQMAGWRIWRDPKLRLKHFLPAGRLNWPYLRRICRGYGRSSVLLDGYWFAAGERENNWKGLLRKSWQWHMLAAAAYLLRRPVKLIRSLLSPLEGDPEVPMLEMHIGRIAGYLHNRGTYRAARAQVRQFLSSPKWGRAMPCPDRST